MIRNETDQALLENVGILFMSCRVERELTQRQAAAVTNSTQARVSYLEAGKADIQLLTLEKFANAYGYHIQIGLIPMDDEPEEEHEAAEVQEAGDQH